MRIGFDGRFACDKSKRGIGTYSLNLLREVLLLDGDFELFLFLDNSKNSYIPEFYDPYDRLVICRIPVSNYPLWEQVLLPFYLLIYKIDILHSVGNTAPLLRFSKYRLIVTVHDVMFMKSELSLFNSGNFYQFFGSLYRRIITPIAIYLSNHIITVSEFSRRDIIATLGLKSSSKICTIYESFDTEFINCNPSLIDISNPYFMCLGGIDPRKNTRSIIESFLRACDEFDPLIKLKVIGLNEKIGRSYLVGLEDLSVHFHKIDFLPYVSIAELKALYSNSIGFVYASKYEGFGIPLLEAFYCRCPIIASNITSIPEIAGDAAYFVDPYSTEEIKKAFVEFSSNSGLKTKLIQKGVNRLSSFQWNIIAFKTYQIYTKI